MLETVSAALVVIVFLVPGFVWRTVESQFVYLDKRLEWEKLVLGLLTRSTVAYLPCAGFIHRGWKNNWIDHYPFRVGLAAAFLLLAVPTVLGCLVGIAKQERWAQVLLRNLRLRTFEQHNIPSAWDYRFSHLRATWVIVTFKDGRTLYGYAGADAYFSSDPDERDFYLSKVVRPNERGEFEFVQGSAGAYIRGEEVAAIEFICPEGFENPNDAQGGGPWLTKVSRPVKVLAALFGKLWKKVTGH